MLRATGTFCALRLLVGATQEPSPTPRGLAATPRGPLEFVSGIGGRGGSSISVRRFDERPPSVVTAGYVSDADLPAVYSAAQAFVYPSLYEGFGLPVLEAMACGTPVVCSQTTSLPEVVHDAGILVDPYEPSAIAEGIRSVVENQALQHQLRQRGLTRAREYTWERAASITWQVLQDAAANN